jgi:hypothetical protein
MALNFWKVAKGIFFTPQSGTPSSPNDGDVYYSSALSKWQFREGSLWKGLGSGSAGINYITNPDADGGTSGWNLFKDAAATSPADGTGGSATHLSIATSGTSPLRGTNSFVLSNSGSTSAQGEGVSFDFTIDAADRAKILDVSFDYTISSGVFQSGSQGPSLQASDVTMWIYDVTNAVVIQPAPYVLTGNGSGSYRFLGNFQTASNSTSYRLIMFVGTTNTLAWALKFDNVVVGPQVLEFGAPVTSPVAYPLQIIGSVSNPTKATTPDTDNATWARFGKYMYVHYEYSASSATGAAAGSGTYLFPLPAGYVCDTSTLLPDGGQNGGTVGAAQVGTATDNLWGAVKLWDATHLSIEIGNNNVAKGQVTSTNYQLTTTGLKYSFEAMVPILGWESNVQMSQDASTRVVTGRFYLGTNQNITQGGSPKTVLIDSATFDTHGGFNAGSNGYVVQVPGYYSIFAQIQYSGAVGGYRQLDITQNGGSVSTTAPFPTDTNGIVVRSEATVYCKVGDLIGLITYQNSGGTLSLSGNALNTYFQINRLAGPESIAASEKVVCSYNSPSALTVTTANQRILFQVKQIDTHGAYNPATGRFTCPVAGLYKVSALQTMGGASSATAVGGAINLSAEQLGSSSSSALLDQFIFQQTASSTTAALSGEIFFDCRAGDTIDVYIAHTANANDAAIQTNSNNRIMIEKMN